jgi:hypothetical protein
MHEVTKCSDASSRRYDTPRNHNAAADKCAVLQAATDFIVSCALESAFLYNGDLRLREINNETEADARGRAPRQRRFDGRYDNSILTFCTCSVRHLVICRDSIECRHGLISHELPDVRSSCR